MASPAGGTAPAASVETGGNPILEVFFSPSAAMDSLARRPRFLIPLLITTFVGTVVMSIGVQRGIAEHNIRQKMESNPRLEQIPADRREQIIDQSARISSYFYIAGAVIGTPAVLFAGSGIFLLLAKIMGAAKVQFRQMLAVVSHGWLPHALANVIAIPILFAKEPTDVDLQNIVPMSNLSLLFSPTEQHKAYLAASSIDLFSFWVIFLLVLGISRITGKSKASALPIVLIPWALFVCIKVVTG